MRYRIAVLVAGSRGDVQPALAIALRLSQRGNTVWIATHAALAPLVRSLAPGLPCVSIGGCPNVLLRVAVVSLRDAIVAHSAPGADGCGASALSMPVQASRGMLPCSWQDMVAIRREYTSLVHSLLPAALMPPELETDEEDASPQRPRVQGRVVPDLIVTTPLTYGVAHVAEALDVPLHVISAVPWFPSEHLGHPWACTFGRPWDQLALPLLRWLPCLPPPPGQGPALASAPQPPGRDTAAPSQPPDGTVASPSTALWRPWARAATGDGERRGPSRDGVLEAWARWVRRTSTRLLDHMVWYGIADVLLQLRRDLGLPPEGWAHGGDCLYRWPTTLTFSPTLLPPPPDYPPHVVVSGPLLLTHARTWPTANEVLAPSAGGGGGGGQDPHPSPPRGAAPHAAPSPAGPPLSQQPQAPATAQGRYPALAHASLSEQEQGKHSRQEQEERAGPGGQEQQPEELPTAVQCFLDVPGASPPVLISFGSASEPCASRSLAVNMMLAAALSGTRLLVHRSLWVGVTESWRELAAQVQALIRRQTGLATRGDGVVRALLTTGTGLEERLRGLMLLVDDLPHHLLLPRCAGIIHHGGAGTVHAALLAGCPMLCVPLYGDNFMWAVRVARMGLGPEPLTLAQARDGRRLAQGLMQLAGEPSYRHAAATLGACMRKEEEPGLDVLERRIMAQLAELDASRAATDGGGGGGSDAMFARRSMLRFAASGGAGGSGGSGGSGGIAGGSVAGVALGDGASSRATGRRSSGVGASRQVGGAAGAGTRWQEVLMQLCRYWYG